MANNNNMLQLCRLCLVKDDVNIPIFEEQGDIRQIFLKISSCLPVKVSREDRLPKKICDGCSYKLDMLYEFWNTSANAEKQLLSWLGEAGVSSKMADGAISAVAQQMRPAEACVKEETLEPEHHLHGEEDDKDYLFEQQRVVEAAAAAGPSATVTSNDEEEPPPKRARRTAAVKAAIAMDQDSDDDDDSGEPLTKIEDESDDSEGEDHVPAFVDVPSTSADDQPGPSGVGKEGVEAPFLEVKKEPTVEEYVIEIFPALSDPLETQRVVNEMISTPKTAPKHKLASGAPFCNRCQTYYADPILHALHTLKHSNGLFDCPTCPLLAKMTEEQVETHVRIHEENPKHTCPKCGLKLYSDSTAIKHEKSHFGMRKPLPCGLCEATFLFPCTLSAHETTEHGDVIEDFRKETKAKQEEDIRKKSVVKEHLPYANKPLGPVLCQYCNETFRSNIQYGHHLTKFHSLDEKFKCFLCKSPVRMDEARMENHLRRHEFAQTFKCSVCGEGFCQRQDAEDHERFHEQKGVECNLCDSEFLFSRCLFSHLKNLHNVQARGAKCSSCDQNHKDAISAPVDCSTCGKTFPNAKALRVHEGDPFSSGAAALRTVFPDFRVRGCVGRSRDDA